MSAPGASEVGETVAGMLRLAAQLASHYAEHIARRNTQAAALAAAGQRAEAQQLAARLAAERDAARAAVAVADRPGWLAAADPAEVARTWEIARAWAGTDPGLARAADRLETQVRDRYGIDPASLWAQAQAARGADRAAEVAEAGAVVGADRAAETLEDRRAAAEQDADLDAFRDEMAGELGGYPMSSPTFEETASPSMKAAAADHVDLGHVDLGDVDLLASWGMTWDSAAARALRADRATLAAGPDAEAAEAVTTADLAQGTPPAAAVAETGRVPAKAKVRGPRGRGAEVEAGR